ncbi:MAG: diaminopimelate decarboxylase, partial [Oscillospiraceae bacterium]|nr:diaminopimelate decarboxylase [Oscillospiraceae bacterium]
MAEFLTENMSVNENGNFSLCGVDTVSLAKEYGTPLYVMDEALIRKNCRDFRESIDRYYGGNGLVCYASKAFSCKEIYRIVDSERLGIDVVSAGELYTALSVGFPAERIGFHGNNKTEAELRYAVESNVGRIIVDNLTELSLLNRIAEEADKTVAVMFRIKPGIDAHTHSFVQTGQIDSKFGFALETGEAMEAVQAAVGMTHLVLKGMHCHIGSQIFDVAPFVEAARVMMRFLADIREETGLTICELDLGGGFGIKYTEEDTPVPYDCYMNQVSDVIKETAEAYGLPVPFVYIEPGRSIVGAAGVTLYTVGG